MVGLQCLGCVGLSFLAFQLVKKVFPWVYMNLIGPKLFGPKVDFSTLGKWAIVTGATDGIGKAYAKALAKKGFNIVLISRSSVKLEAVAQEILKIKNVELKLIEIDFTHDLNIYEKIKKEIEGLDVGILVNNVGISYSYPEYFLEYYKKNPSFLNDLVAANVHSVTHMTALVLGNMVAKKKGVIINISSTAGVIPNPLLCVYSGTKAFVNKFSSDLNTEYRKSGIIVQSVQPGFVATNMSKIKKPTLMAPSPDTFVQSALRTIGIAEQTTGYFPHAVMQLFIEMVSVLTCDYYSREFVLKNLLNIRKKALRHEAKTQ